MFRPTGKGSNCFSSHMLHLYFIWLSIWVHTESQKGILLRKQFHFMLIMTEVAFSNLAYFAPGFPPFLLAYDTLEWTIGSGVSHASVSHRLPSVSHGSPRSAKTSFLSITLKIEKKIAKIRLIGKTSSEKSFLSRFRAPSDRQQPSNRIEWTLKFRKVTKKSILLPVYRCKKCIKLKKHLDEPEPLE